MRKLSVNGQIFEAERIVKSANSISGYTKGTEVYSFNGISDFSSFILMDGMDFDTSDSPEIEKLRLEMARSNAEMFEAMIALVGGV